MVLSFLSGIGFVGDEKIFLIGIVYALVLLITMFVIKSKIFDEDDFGDLIGDFLMLLFFIIIFGFTVTPLSSFLMKNEEKEGVMNYFVSEYNKKYLTESSINEMKPFKTKVVNLSSNEMINVEQKFILTENKIEKDKDYGYLIQNSEFFAEENIPVWREQRYHYKNYGQMKISIDRYFEYLKRYVENLGGVFDLTVKDQFLIDTFNSGESDKFGNKFWNSEEEAIDFIKNYYLDLGSQYGRDFTKEANAAIESIVKITDYNCFLTVPKGFEESVKQDNFLKLIYRYVSIGKLNKENIENGFVID